MNVDKNALKIVRSLKNFEFEAYLVGGCVRDSIMNKIPNDWDITTNAIPENIKYVLSENKIKCIDTGGEKHGTVTAIIDNEKYEITTYRIDGNYKDNRRPDKVSFTNELKEDLSRRDFTINAIAYDPCSKKFIDPFGGISDIKSKKIKAVGNPNERFKEDALRILRGFRFSAVLDFAITSETFQGMKNQASKIEKISKERIQSEFNQIITTRPSTTLYSMQQIDVLKYIVPELADTFNFAQNNIFHSYNLFMHTLSTMSFVKKQNDICLSLAAMLHDIGKLYCRTEDENGYHHFYGHPSISCGKSKEILKKLKYDKKTIEEVSLLIKYHDYPILTKKNINKLLNNMEISLVFKLLYLKKADIKSQNVKYLQTRIEDINRAIDYVNDCIENNKCFKKKNLAINGNDLIAIGFKPGKTIGNTLNMLLEKVSNDECENSKEILLDLAKNINSKI